MCAPTRADMSITAPLGPRDKEILSDGGLGILRMLHTKFDDRRRALLAARAARTGVPEFLPETASVRSDPHWRVAPPAPGLENRRVEITGPVDRKMTINALNSGASCWMADFEDATSPSWRNAMDGQINLHDAISGTISHEANGKRYAVTAESTPTIVARPRGLHLDERHVLVNGRPVSASLFDFGLYVHHNAARLIARGSGPYFYLPKLESHLEARWWNDVFTRTEQWLRIPAGSIRATVLIETFPAAFEMEEILFELRDHAAGLNAGRWDYIFSVIKTLGTDPEYVLPDRADVTMTVPFMKAYTELLVATCHRRGAMAIGGMAAVIPSKDAKANAAALGKVAADKNREANAGFDGSWVAHPGLIETCRREFDAVLGDRPNQLDRLREDVDVTASDLLAIGKTPGTVTAAGLRANVSVLVRYLDAWLDGLGAVALDGLMEDAATAEISRCQLWQWIQHGTVTDQHRPVTAFMVTQLLEQELGLLAHSKPEAAGERVDALRDLVRTGCLGPVLPPFITTIAYERHLVSVS